jgi:alpha-N-arabinofuranosidase
MKASFHRQFFPLLLRQGLVLACLWAIGVLPVLGQIRAEVRVDASAPQHVLDPRLHGHFIEHIARVVHQGLWAELLRNRKFYPVDPDRTQVADPWKPEADRSHVSYVVDQATALDGISSQRVTLFGESRTWRGIGQTGFDVLGGKEYVAYAWIKAEPANQPVSFRLESAKGEVAAHAEATLQSGDWQKYEVRLRPERDLQPAVFRIVFDSPGVKWVGAASLMPADNIDGLRRDVLEMFKLLGPTIFRWPGGCYADAYDWRKALGPRDRRPPVPVLPLGQPYGYDHGMDPNDFGTDEFIRFCEIMGAEPFINANFGMGTPEISAAWVEYCNGPADSKWGSVRAANGHPKPYGVKQWAIGNEVWGDPYEPGHTTAEGYATYYVPMARAMRAVDPTLRLTAVGHFDVPTAQKDWNEPLLKAAWEEIDFLSLHHYYPAGFWPPALFGRPLACYLAVVADPTRVDKKMREVVALIDQVTQGRKKIQIAFDEWNEWDWDYPLPAPSPDRSLVNQFIDLIGKSALEFNQTMRDGLFAARMLHNFMRLGDRVPIAVRTHPVNSLATMRTDSTRVFMTASGKMMQLYRQHTGAAWAKTEAQAPTFAVPEERWTGIPYLDACATLSADGRKLFVHLLNLHPSEAMETHLRIEGKGVQPQGDVWQIAPEDFMARNNFDVTNVDIKHYALEGAAAEFVRSLPPHSATTLEINLK